MKAQLVLLSVLLACVAKPSWAQVQTNSSQPPAQSPSSTDGSSNALSQASATSQPTQGGSNGSNPQTSQNTSSGISTISTGAGQNQTQTSTQPQNTQGSAATLAPTDYPTPSTHATAYFPNVHINPSQGNTLKILELGGITLILSIVLGIN